jgi:hypothetical protein
MLFFTIFFFHSLLLFVFFFCFFFVFYLLPHISKTVQLTLQHIYIVGKVLTPGWFLRGFWPSPPYWIWPPFWKNAQRSRCLLKISHHISIKLQEIPNICISLDRSWSKDDFKISFNPVAILNCGRHLEKCRKIILFV